MRRLAFWVVALAVLAADQGSKALATRALSPGELVPVVGRALGVRLSTNTGAAFSLFPAGGPALVALTVAAIGVILYFYFSGRAERMHRLMLPALALELGGAAGNLADRLRFGHVVDFIYTSFWPTFNVADIGLTVGAVLLAYCLIVSTEKEPSVRGEGCV
ncbi:MAG: signal peptidase II [Armatimonadetes bacterium]|nr:signal peptidase II [Armatimonadota bacterium]